MTGAVRVAGISQDLRGGHDIPLRAWAYRWDPGKMRFGKAVRKERTRKKRWGVGGICCRLTACHAGSASCTPSSRPGWWDNCLHLIDKNNEALQSPDLCFYLTSLRHWALERRCNSVPRGESQATHTSWPQELPIFSPPSLHLPAAYPKTLELALTPLSPHT